MAEAKIDLPRPDDKLTIMFKGAEKVLFMSYQRLNSCLRLLGEPDNLALFTFDPDLTENSIKVMLAEAGTTAGAMFDTVVEEGHLAYDDAEKIIMWVRDHMTHFFLKRFQDLGSQGNTLGPVADRLKSSLLGSVDSTSSAPVAGLSPAAQVTSKISSADAPSSI